MDHALDKARQTGLGYVGVRNSCHFGAAGAYAAQAAGSGFIGLAMANDIPSVASPGSRGAVTGSNPLAYAVPAGRHRPLMLDMSIATVAGGKVYAARERGEPIPATWLIDEQGQPTDDPQAYPEHSTLTPAAGHKGFGLALLIETLAGALTGAAMTTRVGSWLAGDLSTATQHGAAFLALDVAAIGPDLPARIEGLIDEIHAAPRAVGVDRLYVPGEKEWETSTGPQGRDRAAARCREAGLRNSGHQRHGPGRYLKTSEVTGLETVRLDEHPVLWIRFTPTKDCGPR
jgi:LDH2 family malate/lactate/ureidoglycolate dehydrogenase